MTNDRRAQFERMTHDHREREVLISSLLRMVRCLPSLTLPGHDLPAAKAPALSVPPVSWMQCITSQTNSRDGNPGRGC